MSGSWFLAVGGGIPFSAIAFRCDSCTYDETSNNLSILNNVIFIIVIVAEFLAGVFFEGFTGFLRDGVSPSKSA
jgi:hypothetical protein